jgi:ligand-binding SRPBCC domain-containing protein
MSVVSGVKLQSMYRLEKTQWAPITLEEAWSFFSTPKNLNKITPPGLGFKILSDVENVEMYAGQIIMYDVTPILSIPLRWVTEITHVKEMEYFVDEQRFGPYKFWHHQHFFKSVNGGVEIKDIVHYDLPFGIFGKIAHKLFVKSELEEIFSFRVRAIEVRFGKTINKESQTMAS